MRRFSVAVCLIICFAAVAALSACSGDERTRAQYEINCVYSEEGVLSVGEMVEFSAEKDGQNRAYFNFYPLAMTEQAEITPLENSDVAGSVAVRSVTAGGKSTQYEFSGNNGFIVNLDKSYSSGQRVKIAIDYDLTLPKGDKRLSITAKTVNLGNFYPILAVFDDKGEAVFCDYYGIGDPFYSETADYKVSVTVPSEYTVAASSYASSLDVDGDLTKYEYRQSAVRDFAIVMSKEYNVVSKNAGDTTVNYYYYADQTPEETVSLAAEALNYFSDRFLKYPFDTFSVAQATFSEGGMEYPLSCLVSDKLSVEGYRYALVHEIAHQWWYSLVGNDQVNESYLDESLAEYSAYLFFDEHNGYGLPSQNFIDEAVSAVKLCEKINQGRAGFSPKVKQSLTEYGGEYVYVNMVYNKGLLMMKSAENVLGREKTINRLSAYCKKYAYRIANTEDFLSAMGNLKPIILSYLDGKTALYP